VGIFLYSQRAGGPREPLPLPHGTLKLWSSATNHNVSCVHTKGDGISPRSLDLDFVGAKVLRV
jgi:hypothetical protein